MKTVAASVSAIVSLIAIAFSVFFFMDSRHAKPADVEAVSNAVVETQATYEVRLDEIEIELAIDQLEQITLEEEFMPDVYPSEVRAYRALKKERLKRKVEQATK